jgi:hypothetical protein
VHTGGIGHPSDIVVLTTFPRSSRRCGGNAWDPPVEIQLVIVAVVVAVVVFGLVMLVKYIIQS